MVINGLRLGDATVKPQLRAKTSCPKRASSLRVSGLQAGVGGRQSRGPQETVHTEKGPQLSGVEGNDCAGARLYFFLAGVLEEPTRRLQVSRAQPAWVQDPG